MKGAILFLVNTITSLLNGIGASGANNYLSAGINAFPDVYSLCAGVANNVCKPVAYTLLTVFLLLDLYQTIMQLSQMGGGNLTAPVSVLRALLKYLAVKWAIDYAPNILSAIFSICTSITSSIGGNLGSSLVDTQNLEDAVNAMDSGILESFGALILVALATVVAAVACVAVTMVLLSRFVQVYIFVALAPIPLATLPEAHTAQIGIGFLKGFASVCLQSTVIAVAVRLFPMFASDIAAASNDIAGFAVQIMTICMVLLVCVLTSSQISRSILGN